MPIRSPTTLRVRAEFDAEAKVWYAQSDDVPGLATEAASLDELVSKLKIVIPELMELNGAEMPNDFPFELLARPSPAPRVKRK
jgi:hypothetical protein